MRFAEMQSRTVEIDLIILIGQRKYDAVKTAIEYEYAMGSHVLRARV